MRFERWWYSLRLRLRSLFHGARADEDMDDEIRFHVERQIQAHVEQGMTPRDARYAALRALGGIEQRKEEIRDTRRVRAIDDLVRDVRYGARMLRRSPVFTVVAVLSLALGIGANTAIFQLLDAVRVRALPVARPGDLVTIQIENRGWPPSDYDGRYPDLTYPQWERIRQIPEGFSGLLAWSHSTFDLAPRGESRFVENGLWVSGSFFDVLGVRPELGRVFTDADDVRGCSAPGVVLSHGFWQREFGGAPSAVGAKVTVNGHPLEVIGVTPAAFFGVEVGRSFDLALPLCADGVVNGGSRLDDRATWWLGVMGRLAPGWSIARATAQLHSMSPALFEATRPSDFSPADAATYAGFTLTARPGQSGFSALRQDYDTPLWLLLAIAGVILVIACANLANLLLARMAVRAREMAVRLALGASRRRLVRQLLVESLLLASLGAATGFWLAPLLSRSVVSLIGSDVSPLFVDLTTDWRVMAFTASLTVLTCVLFGLVPALRATRVPPGEAMKSGGRGLTAGREHFGLRRALVVAQVSLSLVLLVGGLLFGRSLFNLLTVDAGFQPAGILEADVDLTRLPLEHDGRRALRREVLDRIRAVPGVEAAASVSNVPLGGRSYRRVFFEGASSPAKVMASFNRVSADYFKTLRTRVVAGRDFDDRDSASSPTVAIVSESFARQYLGGASPLGLTVRFEADRGEPGPPVLVVGIVQDTKYSNLREDFVAIVYLAETQNERPSSWSPVLMRTTSAFADLKPAIASAVEGAASSLSFHFHDFQQEIRYSLRQDRLMAMLCGFFALLGAVLATIGVYGVGAYSVTQRTQEIGIRLALGAGRQAIVGLILREAAVLIGFSLLAGTALAALAARSADAMLFGLRPTDPLTLTAAASLLGAVALVASFVPALRASRVSPTIALRTD